MGAQSGQQPNPYNPAQAMPGQQRPPNMPPMMGQHTQQWGQPVPMTMSDVGQGMGTAAQGMQQGMQPNHGMDPRRRQMMANALGNRPFQNPRQQFPQQITGQY